MEEYKCDRCDKVFQFKKNLKYHLDKNVCVQEDICDPVSFACKYCNKTFTMETNMYRHMRSACRVKKEEDAKKDEIYERLLKVEEDNKRINEENKKLKQKVNTMEKKMKVTKRITNNTNNGTINNGTINNTLNQIVVVGYGHEDLSKLGKSELLKILQNGYHSTIKLTEAVHFNPKYPEYHNVYISNMKDKYAMMYDGAKWTLTMKESLINQIYEDKKNYIEENLEDFVKSLSVSRRKALERWLETDDEDKKIKEIKESIKLLLYNNKNVPLATHKLTEPKIHDKIVVDKIVSKSKKTVKDS
ncbi:hypothetical protein YASMINEVIRUS_1469 [Yasminevirus sp. GU-2018]|uniref:C2H2-type domain-containing protein n=1 Tax=Yasminevirus sp. GU-2018 TaxID=2420051 RepID=A0A5K0UAB3_9VIRU|nr:hypothetical protein YASMINEVIRUS_1469 [Yasminevirus sp. GU-2018]